MNKFLYIIIILLASHLVMHSQTVYGNLKLGAMHYLGDLSPMTSDYSASQANFGVEAGFQIYATEYFSVYTGVLVGKLKGSDAYSMSRERMKRNLSFKTSIYELGFGLKYSLNHFIKYFERIGLNIELVFGGNFFYFNPKTQYNGQWIELQPLATEGQGWLPGQEPKYSLTETSISRGLSIKFKINKKIEIGTELILRKTYTDYLDDVSTFYVNYDEQLANSTELAAQLGNRSGEFLGTDPVQVPTRTSRGNPDKNDSYMFSALTVYYKLYE